MKVLVTGRDGQVAQSIAERWAGVDGIELVFAGRPQFDLADPDTIRKSLRNAAPDVVVSAAAYTAVDLAEDEPDLAARCNGVAPGMIAETCRELDARLIHLSTDYVFPGTGEAPLTETDPTGPTGVYGQTKLDGENAIRDAWDKHVIARTAWVYSPFGKNFVKTMLRLAEGRDELTVVADQFGNPTNALDIADGLLACIAAWRADPAKGLGETYHLAGTGHCSWCDFATHIMAVSADHGGPTATVGPITTADFPTKARRPSNSRLDCSKFEAAFGYRAPEWRASSAAVVERLLTSA